MSSTLVTTPVGDLDVNLCGTAVSVTPVVTGNGGSTFQLFQEVGGGDIFATWSLNTNNINNGADNWIFGWEINGKRLPLGGGYTHDGAGIEELRGAICEKIGNGPEGFKYFIDAGAGGWASSSSCSISFSWELSVGIEVSMTGTGTSASTTLGSSISCSDGTTYDSESLFRDRGTSQCISCIADN